MLGSKLTISTLSTISLPLDIRITLSLLDNLKLACISSSLYSFLPDRYITTYSPFLSTLSGNLYLVNLFLLSDTYKFFKLISLSE